MEWDKEALAALTKSRTAPDLELNADQQAALQAMRDFLAQEEHSAFVLSGSAGTGKTTVTRFLLSSVKGRTPILVAPTHKAVGVLSEMSGSSNVGTLHSKLGLTPRFLDNGDEVYKPGFHYLAKLQEAFKPLLIVDEASMINKDLYAHLLKAQEWLDLKIIFIGDPFQLPPVHEVESETLRVSPRAELVEVMRHTGALFSRVKEVRDTMMTGGLPRTARPAQDDDGEVQLLDRLEWAEAILDAARSGSSYKALAWRNQTVDAINEWVHMKLYGKQAGRWVPGARVVAVDTFTERAKKGKGQIAIALHAEQEAIVEGSESTSLEGIPCTWVHTNRGSFRVLEPEDEPAYRALLARKKSSALKTKKWDQLRKFRDSFCRLRHPHCTTVHKAQGSTYDKVFVHEPDLRANRNELEVAKLLYVAYSRARAGLYIRQ